MGRRRALSAQDDIERQLLLEVAAAPDGKRRAAAEALGLPRRDRIDDLWAGSPMRVAEARALAKWLGKELRLAEVTPLRESPAYRARSQDARRSPPRDRRRTA